MLLHHCPRPALHEIAALSARGAACWLQALTLFAPAGFAQQAAPALPTTDAHSSGSTALLGGELTPRLLYRISPDGKRELVRGAVLDDLDQRTLWANVGAAGKELFVANYFGNVPETVIAPALLLTDVTVRRANEKNKKLPFYPPPE